MIQDKKRIKNLEDEVFNTIWQNNYSKNYNHPQIEHVFISLPNPDGRFIKKLNDIFYEFIWDNKPDKISRKQLANGYLEGGLKMPQILLFIKGLKISWLRRLHQNLEIPWVQLANHFLGDPCNILLLDLSDH